MQISTVLGRVCHFTCATLLWTGRFRHLSDNVFGVLNFQSTKDMRVIFFWKYLKLNLDFKNAVRNSEKNFCFIGNCIWIGIINLSPLRTEYLSSADNVLTWNPKIWHVNKRNFFPTQFSWQWSLNMIKVLWYRFQQFLGTFTILLVKGSSETRFFRYLSNHVFSVRIIGNTKSVRVEFSFKMSRFRSRFQKCIKKLRTTFLFFR